MSVEEKRKVLAKLKKDIEDLKYAAADTSLDEVCERAAVPQSERLSTRSVALLRGHFAKVYAMQWCPNSTMLVSASQDGKLIVWNGLTKNKVHAIPLRSSWVMTCAYSPNGNLVACGGLDNICSVYNLRQREAPIKVTRELSAHTGYLSSCRFVDDRQIITSSGDTTCMLWDVETGSLIENFTGHGGDVMSVSVAHKNPNLFVSGACDMKAMVWDARTGRSVATFSGHTGDINAIQFFPNDNLFATGSDDSECKLHDIRALRELKTYKHKLTNSTGITSIDFSRSGRYIFAGYDDFKVHVWDTIRYKDEISGTLQGHTNRVSCLGVSSDGCAVCTGSWDTFLKVWSTDNKGGKSG